MTDLADKPAFACCDPEFLQEGMTFREYAAVQIMAGIAASARRYEEVETAAAGSVAVVDALIAELEKPQS